MATSGSTDHNLTRDNIIEHALGHMGVLAEGESATSDAKTFAARELNNMIKGWQNRGINLFALQEATIYLTDATASYSLPGATGANTVVETTLSAAEASGQTVLSVTSSTGMTASDVVLVELDDNTLQATTISSVDSSTQITVAAALTGAAASGNNVYTYTTAIGRPVDILSIRFEDDAGNERELEKISRDEYFAITDKDSSSSPVEFYYDPQISTGKLYIWPTPDAVSARLRITYERTLEDFDAAGDNPDFPQEWLDCLCWNLAMRLVPSYGIKGERAARIDRMAALTLEDAENGDAENTSIFVQPDDYDY